METNFKKKSTLVLTNSENKIIAFIGCKRGYANQITNKLEQAIKEDYSADTVIIVDSNTIHEFSEPTDFQVHVYVDGTDYYETFWLTNAVTY